MTEALLETKRRRKCLFGVQPYICESYREGQGRRQEEAEEADTEDFIRDRTEAETRLLSSL